MFVFLQSWGSSTLTLLLSPRRMSALYTSLCVSHTKLSSECWRYLVGLPLVQAVSFARWALGAALSRQVNKLQFLWIWRAVRIPHCVLFCHYKPVACAGTGWRWPPWLAVKVPFDVVLHQNGHCSPEPKLLSCQTISVCLFFRIRKLLLTRFSSNQVVVCVFLCWPRRHLILGFSIIPFLLSNIQIILVRHICDKLKALNPGSFFLNSFCQIGRTLKHKSFHCVFSFFFLPWFLQTFLFCIDHQENAAD